MRLRRFLAVLAFLALPSFAAAATGTVMTSPFFLGFTDAGVICSACKLYTYTPGTTTLLTTYSNSALSAANANPVVLDSAGRATVFLSATAYKFVLKTSADVTIWTQDNVGSVPYLNVDLDITVTAGEALTATQCAFLSDGSGGNTSGRWYLCDADNTYGSNAAPMVGFVVTDIASAAAGTVRLLGRMTGFSGLTAGTSYYISATAGAITATAPAANVRFIGAADSATALVLAPNQAPAASVTLPGIISLSAQTFGAGDKSLLMGTGSGTALVGGVANANATSDTCTAFGGEEDFMSYTLPANSLATSLRSVRITAWGLTAANANNKRMRLYFGGTAISDSGAVAMNALNWRFDADIIRDTAAVEVYSALWTLGAAATTTSTFVTIGSLAISTTATIVIKVTGLCATANGDATQTGMVVTFR